MGTSGRPKTASPGCLLAKDWELIRPTSRNSGLNGAQAGSRLCRDVLDEHEYTAFQQT